MPSLLAPRSRSRGNLSGPILGCISENNPEKYFDYSFTFDDEKTVGKYKNA
jgi:hypothetical protein